MIDLSNLPILDLPAIADKTVIFSRVYIFIYIYRKKERERQKHLERTRLSGLVLVGHERTVGRTYVFNRTLVFGVNERRITRGKMKRDE